MKTTGRKFKCIGLDASEMYFWTDNFSIGTTYEEIEHPYLASFGGYDRQGKLNNCSIRLVNNIGIPFWVDASQFELV